LRKLTAVVAVPVALAFLAVLAAPALASNDPLRSLQWGLDKIQAEQAWGVTRGSGAVIAVLDTGVDLTHPDLAANVLSTGHDFVDNDNTPQDQHGHGTHVAGIAAAVADNGIGGSGVAPAAKILPVRVLDATGSGDATQIAAGIRYAATHGANVISLSLGEDTVLGTVGTLIGVNDDLHAAIDQAWAAGAVIVIAAGNQSAPLCAEPAAAVHVLCVGSTDRNDTPSYFSNGGSNSSDFVTAPGGSAMLFCEDDILSTFLRTATASVCSPGAGYDYMAGTSMATPFVSGEAALLASKGLNNAQIVTCIKRTADHLTPLSPGRINANRAVHSC
jgi:serine protease